MGKSLSVEGEGKIFSEEKICKRKLWTRNEFLHSCPPEGLGGSVVKTLTQVPHGY